MMGTVYTRRLNAAGASRGFLQIECLMVYLWCKAGYGYSNKGSFTVTAVGA